MKIFSLLPVLLFVCSLMVYSQDFWEPTNGPYGEIPRVYSITVNDLTGDVFVINITGVYRSTDNGDNWEDLGVNGGEEYTTLKFNSLGHIFILYEYLSIIRSTDNGVNWTELDVNGNQVISLAINSDSLISAGTSNGGIFCSTDNGDNWTCVGFEGNKISEIELNSEDYIFIVENDNNIHYSDDDGTTWTNTGFGNFAINDIEEIAFNVGPFLDDIFVTTLNNGICRSTDYGENWSFLDSLLFNYNEIIDFNSFGLVFAASHHNLYRSTDNGDNWTNLYTVGGVGLAGIALNSNDHIFLSCWGDDSLYRSIDNGDNWEAMLEIEDVWDGCIAIKSNNDIFIGSWSTDGVFRSTDNGNNWVSLNSNFPQFLLLVFRVAVNSNDDIFAGGHGLYRSTDNAANWVYTGFEKDITSIAINSEDIVFVGGRDGVFRSDDNGNTFDSIGFSGYDKNIYLNVSSQDHIFAGIGDTVFYSSDNGSSWQGVFSVENRKVSVLEIDNEDNIFVEFVGGGSGTLYRSTDNGSNWTISVGDTNITAISFNSSNHIYAACPEEGIFYSTNNGDNWEQLNFVAHMIPAVMLPALIINSIDRIFISAFNGEEAGIFRSTDNGDIWIDVSSGLPLPYPFAFDLALNSEEYLFCSLFGVYKSKDSTTVGIEDQTNSSIPVSFNLEQNYPNPFNPTTTISYQIPELSFVTVKVYDVLGKEVATLVNEEKPVGSYEVEFNASTLPSGIYFYRLQAVPTGRQAGSFVETNKMVLIK